MEFVAGFLLGGVVMYIMICMALASKDVIDGRGEDDDDTE